MYLLNRILQTHTIHYRKGSCVCFVYKFCGNDARSCHNDDESNLQMQKKKTSLAQISRLLLFISTENSGKHQFIPETVVLCRSIFPKA